MAVVLTDYISFSDVVDGNSNHSQTIITIKSRLYLI